MNPVGTYFEQYVLSADPVDLVRMMFGRATALVQEARRHLATGEIMKRSEAIYKCYDILLELISSLNDEAAPELCNNLRGLYFYMQQRLLDGNLQQSDAPLAEVLGLLTTLGESWQPAAAPKAAPVPEQPYGSARPLHENHAVSRAYAA